MLLAERSGEGHFIRLEWDYKRPLNYGEAITGGDPKRPVFFKNVDINTGHCNSSPVGCSNCAPTCTVTVPTCRESLYNVSQIKIKQRKRYPHHSEVKNLITELTLRETELAVKIQQSFAELMRDLPGNERELFSLHKLQNGKDIDDVPSGRGFYVILSDFLLPNNACRLHIDSLTAVYRGHANEVRERIRSHLDYPEHKRIKGTGSWDRCLKLAGLEIRTEGGLDINSPALAGISWAVLVLRLPKSSEFQRKQAEWAFDDVFEQPLGSLNEKSVRPKT